MARLMALRGMLDWKYDRIRDQGACFCRRTLALRGLYVECRLLFCQPSVGHAAKKESMYALYTGEEILPCVLLTIGFFFYFVDSYTK